MITAKPVSGVRKANPVQLMRDMWVDSQMSQPAISANPLSQFTATANATTKGVDVVFQVLDDTGVQSISLLRATVLDTAQATVLQTWAAQTGKFTWSDTDAALQQSGQAYYWVRLAAKNVNGSPVTVGPQKIQLNASLVAPSAATAISASHAAAANGNVLITCNVAGIPAGDSVKITVKNYQGNSAEVAFVQSSAAPLQFSLQATGETVTLKALVVSAGGVAAASGPTCTLTLSGSATVPATPMGVTVTQISTGNQVTWPASIEAGVTQYKVYRGQRLDAFISATLLATVTATGTGIVNYLDTGGLSSDYQYFIETVSGAGTSAPSAAAYPAIMYSSALIPVNAPTNTTNTATVDSIDGGGSALARIYGPGGVGTSYQRLTGYGSLTRPNGSISGLAYKTKYVVLYDTVGKSYSAVTTYPATLPDTYEYVGALTTTAHGSASGSGATATAVIDGSGHVIQINPTANGSNYVTASVTISGGGGSGAAANANVDFFGSVTSYTVTNGGSGYTTAPTVTVTPGSAGGTTGGGTSTGNTGGSRIGIPYPL